MIASQAQLTTTEQQRKAVIEALERMNERARRDADYAKRVLVEEGVYTKDGQIGIAYR